MARTELRPGTVIGRELEARRLDQALTKEAWCLMLDVSKPSYLMWLARPVDIESQNVRRIAEVLEVSIGTVHEWLEADRSKKGRTVSPIIHGVSTLRRPKDNRPANRFLIPRAA